MPTTHNWIIATGSATWAAASFDTGVLPVTGDTVNITTGNADINAGLNQSGVVLAALTIAGTFSGTIGDTSGNALQIGFSTAAPLYINCQSGRIVIDLGTSSPSIIVTGSSSSLDSPMSSVRFRNGGTSTKIQMAGSSTDVGFAQEKRTYTASLAEWDIKDGNLYLGPGTVWVNGYQDGGTVTTNSGGTLIQQSGSSANLTTLGAGAITTIDLTANAKLNHRPGGGVDAWATLNVGPGASADVSTDPRPLSITNPINMSKGANFTAFDPAQVTMHPGTGVQFRTQQCSLIDCVIDIGTPVLATLVTG